MSLAENAPRNDWPVVGPLTRAWRRVGAGMVAVLVATAVLGALTVLAQDQHPPWRLLLAGAGLLLILGCAAYGGWMLWCGTPMRVVRPAVPAAPVTAPERRRIRRALLGAGELESGDERRTAELLAGTLALRPVTALMGGASGITLLTLSTTGSESLPFMIPLAAVGVAAVLFLAAAAWWALRIRRPAEAIGAVPTCVTPARRR